jgi:hypothetical protein
MHLGISEEEKISHAKAQRTQRNPFGNAAALAPFAPLREPSSRSEKLLIEGKAPADQASTGASFTP